jgi:hypothetical protein
MRSLFGVVILGAPALAFAQPGADPSPPPPQGPYQPATGNPPYSAPPPAQPGPYNPNNGTQPYTPPPPNGPAPGQQPYPQPQPYPQQPQPYYPQPQQGPYGQQPYGYQPYQQPYQQPPPPRNLRDGMTFEINLGIGWLQADDEYTSDTSDAGLGFGLGIGGWLGTNMAVTGRLASTSVKVGDDGYGGDITMHGMFLGPSLQYWVDEGLFIRAGLGIAIAGVSSQYSDESDSINGFGLDLGVGYNFSRGTENTFNASLELTPGFYSENGESATLGGISLLVGYQHL